MTRFRLSSACAAAKLSDAKVVSFRMKLLGKVGAAGHANKPPHILLSQPPNVYIIRDTMASAYNTINNIIMLLSIHLWGANIYLYS